MLVQTDNQTPVSASAKEKPKLLLHVIKREKLLVVAQKCIQECAKVKQIIKSMGYMFVNCLSEKQSPPRYLFSTLLLSNL